jgi:predicted nucleic acid-binding protein
VILADTSVWIDHLRVGDPHLTGLLRDSLVLGHAWITGEIALGQLAHRHDVLGLLANLPQATLATDAEIRTVVETRRLFGTGIGYVDAQLLTATLLTSGSRLWTRDKRLAAAAATLGVAVS